MSTVVKDLGAVSAYAYAVEKGYTGTEAEFAELMASYAEVGQTATDAAESALNSKTAAQTAATTATNKASEATTAAQTATTKAGEATTAAGTATTAKNDAVAAKTAAETAQGKAEDAQAAAESVAASIPSDYSQLSADVSQIKEDFDDVKDDLTAMQTATASDVGKALKAKTVTDGKVTEWEFGETGVAVDPTLTVEGKAADAKAAGDAISKLSDDVDALSAEFGTYTIDPDDFEVGNISITVNGWTYGSNPNRVRTKPNVTLSLRAGYVVSLSDYSDARFFLGWLVDGTYKTKGWNTSDYTVTEDGEYVILLTNKTEVSQEGDKTRLLNLLSISNPNTIGKQLDDMQESIDNLSDTVSASTDDVSNSKKALQSLNLFDHSTYIVGQLDPDGTTYVVNYNKTGTSDFIEVEAGETYTMQVWATPLGETDAYKLRFTTLCFDANKTPISSSYITTMASSVTDTYFATTRTIPTGAKYIKICTRYLDDANTRMMVNKGSLAMAYMQSANDEEYNRKAILSSMSSVAYGLTSPLLRPAYPRVMMHRGFSSQAPENTIPAFTLAGQGGAWGIETDVYETTDGYFVLSHDNDVSRMTDGTGNITEMTYAQTQACTIDAGANIEQYPNLKMPVLSDYLKICRKYGCVAVIEIKTIINYANLVKIIKDYGMEGSVVILTYYNATQFATIRSLIQCPVCFVCTGQAHINNLLTVAQNNVDVWASVYSIYVTQENIDACHAVGIPFAGWTYTTQAGCESAVEMGMDIITGEGFAKYVPA